MAPVNPTTPRRVLLPASTPLSYAVAGPVLARLAAEPGVVILVSGRHGGAELARRCLPFPFRYVPRPLVGLARADLALCPGFHFRRGRARLTVQMFHGVSPKNYAIRREAVGYDHLFLIGEYHRAKLVRAGLVRDDDPRLHRIGMPKTDPLVRPATGRDALLARLGLDPGRPTVAFVPTRSGDAGSALEAHGTAVFDALARLPVNVLVKLHDRSRPRFRRKLRVDWEAVARAREAGSTMRVVDSHDVIPVLLAADVLVSDLSSAAHEFLLRDRPLIHLEVPRHEAKLRRRAVKKNAGDHEDLDWLRAAGETCAGPEGLGAAIERALTDPGAKSDLRRDRAARLFYNPGHATAAAHDALRGLLRLDVHEAPR